jgi:hypothetical protein
LFGQQVDNILDRFQARQRKQQSLRLYALVDGYQYAQHFGKHMRHEPDVNHAVLVRAEYGSLAHAGPWLIVGTKITSIQHLEALEMAPSVSWLFTSVSLERKALKRMPNRHGADDSWTPIKQSYLILNPPIFFADGSSRPDFFTDPASFTSLRIVGPHSSKMADRDLPPTFLFKPVEITLLDGASRQGLVAFCDHIGAFVERGRHGEAAHACFKGNITRTLIVLAAHVWSKAGLTYSTAFCANS